MSPAEPASDSSSAHPLSLLEIIFSCGVCQANISEIYASPESNKGFHNGAGDDDGVVTRLWIAECSHVTCGKHLAGGAAPFHPREEQPRATCPQCAREGDSTPKNLFGIRGIGQGEYDQGIPSAWFQCPPVTLDGAAPGQEAVRFQFMALARYAQKVHTRWKTAEEKREAAAQVISRERKLRKQMQVELGDGKAQADQQAAELKQLQGSLKKWEERKPIINHLVAAVKPMADDLRQMRLQLLDLGFDIPMRSYAFENPEDRSTETAGATNTVTTMDLRRKSSIRDRVRSTHDDAHLPNEVGPINSKAAKEDMTSSSSSKKRKRENDAFANGHALPYMHRTSSRDLMPPPPNQKLSAPKVQPHATAHGLPILGASRSYGMYENRPHHTQQIGKPQYLPSNTNHSEILNERELPDGDYKPYAFPQPQETYLQQSAYPGPRTLVDAGRLHQYRGEVDQPSRPILHPSPSQRSLYSRNALSQFELQKNDEASHRSRNFATRSSQQVQMRQALRPVSTYQRVPQTPMKPSYLNAKSIEAETRDYPGQTVTGSISSPFFRRGTNFRHLASASRPPTRGSNVSRTSELYGEQGRNFDRNLSQNEVGFAYQNRSDHSARLHLPAGSPAQKQIPTSATLPHRGDLRQGHVNKVHGSSLRNSPYEMEYTTSPRSRITLPPSPGIRNTNLTTIRESHEYFPRHNENYFAQQAAHYNDSRPLFSAAGRRSVRR